MSYYNDYQTPSWGPRDDYDRRVRPARYRSGRPRKAYYDGSFNGSRLPSKRSGAKYGISPKTKKPYVQGWKSTKAGIITVIAGPTKKGMVSEQSEQWVANVKVGFNAPQTMTAFWNVNSRKLTIPDLNFVLNPNAPNGGYCGPFYKRRRR